jgi:hypothetical protein
VPIFRDFEHSTKQRSTHALFDLQIRLECRAKGAAANGLAL